MTISGALPSQTFPPLEFLPVSKAPKYIADLEQELADADGSPLWFVHDGQTGTSHEFVCNAQNYYNEHQSLDETLLLRLMKSCIEAGSVFRIWWASGEPNCHRDMREFAGSEELGAGLSKMLSEGRDICLRRTNGGLTNNRSGQKTAK